MNNYPSYARYNRYPLWSVLKKRERRDKIAALKPAGSVSFLFFIIFLMSHSEAFSTNDYISCLDQYGPLVVLKGWQSRYNKPNLPQSTKADATAATWIGPSSSPDNNRVHVGANGLCWSGGEIIGSFPDNMSWRDFHKTSAFGVRNSTKAIIEGVRIDNYGDSININRYVSFLGTSVGDGFVIRGNHISYSHDDCIENDFGQAGTIEDNLMDGCYMGYSSRPPQAQSGYNGPTTTVNGVTRYDVQARNKVVTYSNNLVRLQVMPSSYQGPPGHAEFWKLDPGDTDPRLSVHNNIFRVDAVPLTNSPGGDSHLIPPAQYLTSCSNNVIVWLGGGDFPEPLPNCYTVTDDISVWNNAVQDWLDNHPDVAQ